MDRRLQRRVGTFAVALAIALGARTGTSFAKADDGFAGSWLLTQVGGGGVHRSVLRLAPDGHATMRTDFSRYTARPERAAPVPPVVQSGTWTRRGDRAVVRFVTSSSEDSVGDTHRPQFDEVLFTRVGCSLRLVGSAASSTESGFGQRGLEFTKPHCVVPS